MGKDQHQHQAGLGQFLLSAACSRCEQTSWRAVVSEGLLHTQVQLWNGTSVVGPQPGVTEPEQLLCQPQQAGKAGVCGELFLSSGLGCGSCPCSSGDSSCL